MPSPHSQDGHEEREAGISQLYHRAVLIQRREHTSQTFSEICPSEQEGIIIFSNKRWVHSLMGILSLQYELRCFLSPQRFALHIEEDTSFFFFICFLISSKIFIFMHNVRLWGRGIPCIMFVSLHQFLPQQICRKNKACQGPHRFLVCLHSLNKRRKDLRQVPMFQSSRKWFWAIIRENSKEGGKREITGLVKACKTTPVIKTSYAVLGLQKLSLTKELIHTHTKGKKLAIKKYFSIMQLLQLYNWMGKPLICSRKEIALLIVFLWICEH